MRPILKWKPTIYQMQHLDNGRSWSQFCIYYLSYFGDTKQAALGCAVWLEFPLFARFVAAVESAERVALAMCSLISLVWRFQKVSTICFRGDVRKIVNTLWQKEQH